MFQTPGKMNRRPESEYNSSSNKVIEQFNTATNGISLSHTTETVTKKTTKTTVVTMLEGRGEGMGVISNYIQRALSKARYQQFDDGSYYAVIPECPGVWANEESPEQCKTILAEALEDWILLKLQDGDPLPDIDGIRLKMEEAASWTP